MWGTAGKYHQATTKDAETHKDTEDLSKKENGRTIKHNTHQNNKYGPPMIASPSYKSKLVRPAGNKSESYKEQMKTFSNRMR